MVTKWSPDEETPLTVHNDELKELLSLDTPRLLTKPYRTLNGLWFTNALFAERLPDDHRYNVEAPMTLYRDVPGKINAHRTFVDTMDPTGYTWAITYLDSWPHFERLLKTSWFREHVESWQREIAMKLKSDGIARLRDIALGSTNSAGAAAKYMADEGFTRTPRGRPSKADVAKATKEITDADASEVADLARIGLRVIPGGAG